MKTHCVHGHPRTPDNVSSSGACKACWSRKNRTENRKYATCHPDRKCESLDLCSPCYLQRFRLRRHGWSLDRVEAYKILQKNLCAICGDFMENPQADHEHVEPPNPRELLCGLCNKALGLFRDSPDIIRRAAQYIEKHRK